MAGINAGEIIGSSDIVLMSPVTDLDVPNSLNLQQLRNAAAAICAMVKVPPVREEHPPVVGASMLGTTTACVQTASGLLRDRGYEVASFHAIGPGGEAMERFIRCGRIAGVLDLTITEMSNHLLGGDMNAGCDRMTAAINSGVPQVVAPGGIESVLFSSRAAIPARYQGRYLKHLFPSSLWVMKVNGSELSAIASELAARLNRETGSGLCTVCIPLRGFSSVDRDGTDFDLGMDRRVFLDTFRTELVNPRVKVLETDLHICDQEFGEMAAYELLRLLSGSRGAKQ
jgi:uncharacterized protein (UPF0261 family)